MSRPDLDEVEAPPVPPQVPRMDGAAKPVAAFTDAHTAQRSEPHETELRPGDSGEDRPLQVPRDLQALSEADLRALAAAEERVLLKELREAEELIASDPSVLGLPGYLSHPLMLSAVIGMAGVLGLFLFNQIGQAIALMGSLQGYWMYGGYVGLGILCAAAGYAMLRMLWIYFSLRRNRQLRIKGLEELEKRTKLRWLVNAKLKEAKTLLQGYLKDFPLKPGRDRRKLIALGITEAEMLELGQIRERLLDVDRWPSDDAWFAAFGLLQPKNAD